ncbi:MAG: MFS transporter, partial [Tannerella sp.]|nr:MFS transporter [Tannerella sp.]
AFGARSGHLIPWMNEFGLTAAEVGWIASAYLWGATVSALLFGLLVEAWGTAKVVVVFFIAQLAGIILTFFATGFWPLFLATMLIGVANGSLNAACNPLVTSLFPNAKTARLNLFHMWNAIGIAMGGLMVFVCNHLGVNWRIQIAVLLIPTLLYGLLFFRQKFPATERSLLGGSYKDMLNAIISPLFLFLAFLMILTSGLEFGANQWIPSLFENAVTDLFGESAFGSALILVWISLAMAFARLFAAPMVRTFSPTGVLLLSTLFAGVGIYLISVSDGWLIFLAATIFALGVAYFWPNMLGLVAEQRPMSGALGLAIIGGMGTLGGALIQPIIGGLFDRQMQLHNDNLTAGSATLQYLIVIPVFLVIVFAVMAVRDRKRRKEGIS